MEYHRSYPYSYHPFLEFSSKILLKNSAILLGNEISQQLLDWKIWSVYTSNGNNIWLIQEVNFHNWFGEIREITLPKNYSTIFHRTFQENLLECDDRNSALVFKGLRS